MISKVLRMTNDIFVCVNRKLIYGPSSAGIPVMRMKERGQEWQAKEKGISRWEKYDSNLEEMCQN